MGNFKQTNLKNFLTNLCNDIFEDNQSIEKRVFISKIKSVHTNYCSNIIFALFDLIKVELELIQSDDFTSYYTKKQNSSNSNMILSSSDSSL